MPSSSLHYLHPTSKVTDLPCSPRWPSRVVTTTWVIVYTPNPLNRLTSASYSTGEHFEDEGWLEFDILSRLCYHPPAN